MVRRVEGDSSGGLWAVSCGRWQTARGGTFWQKGEKVKAASAARLAATAGGERPFCGGLWNELASGIDRRSGALGMVMS